MNDPLHGILTRAGTFMVSDEELTGFMVVCPRETLEKAKTLPMYRDVVILETAVLLETKRKIGFVIGALETLRAASGEETQKTINRILEATISI